MVKQRQHRHFYIFDSIYFIVNSQSTGTRRHTPVLVNGEEVEPFILVFLGTKHGYLIVDKHPVQALIRD